MNRACGFFLIVFLLSLEVSFGQEENNSALDKIISIEAHNETLASVLEKIAVQAQVYFSYDPSIIHADKKIDASFTSKSIRDILNVLLDSKFTYQPLDQQIVITPPDTASETNKEAATDGKHQIITFRGKVIDRDQKDPLPFSTISVQKSNIGTISNGDGEFELKIPSTTPNDSVVVSCLGYKQFHLPVSEIGKDAVTILLQPATFQLGEIMVTYISPQDILSRIVSKIGLNYPQDPEIMTSFYREVLKQDKNYIDVAEAVMDIVKSSYGNVFTEDKVKIIKGSKGLNVKPCKLVDFKIQGGPYYITKLDVVKTLDSFLDPEFTPFYKYTLEEIVDFNDRSTYVIHFKPKEKVDNPFYQGTLLIDMSSFALVQADFELNRSGLKLAQNDLIKKKPKDFFVRPLQVRYLVQYRRSEEKWHLSIAQASMSFRVRSKQDKINSVFHSTSDLLITDFKPDDGTHFKRNELFNSKDIFTEMINRYDENFWGDYNIIKPSEDLNKALKKYYQENDTLFNSSNF
ncbi:MAG TPA: hypothetical protein DCL77_06615 [Prolixibacteraceae bacterium]|jgi:hypothetical protein|nr:hypothetical protein [Prolixibacteraceae bacterium]